MGCVEVLVKRKFAHPLLQETGQRTSFTQGLSLSVSSVIQEGSVEGSTLSSTRNISTMSRSYTCIFFSKWENLVHSSHGCQTLGKWKSGTTAAVFECTQQTRPCSDAISSSARGGDSSVCRAR